MLSQRFWGKFGLICAPRAPYRIFQCICAQIIFMKNPDTIIKLCPKCMYLLTFCGLQFGSVILEHPVLLMFLCPCPQLVSKLGHFPAFSELPSPKEDFTQDHSPKTQTINELVCQENPLKRDFRGEEALVIIETSGL